MKTTRLAFAGLVGVLFLASGLSAQSASLATDGPPTHGPLFTSDPSASEITLSLVASTPLRTTDEALESAAPTPVPAFLGLSRGSRIGALSGGLVVGVYTAVYWNRECEGSCNSPALTGFLMGAGVGALTGAIVGGLVDYLFF